jgi:hypothetical protein
MQRNVPTGIGCKALVFGDMFDGDAETLVVPCSTSGTISAEIRSHLRALGKSARSRERHGRGFVHWMEIPGLQLSARDIPLTVRQGRITLVSNLVSGFPSYQDASTGNPRRINLLTRTTQCRQATVSRGHVESP